MCLRPAIGLSTTSNPSLGYRRFTKSSSSLMPTPLTREMFMSSDYAKVTAARPTMFQLGEDDNITEVPVPEHVKETGIIPEGHSVGSSFNGVHSG